MNCPNVEPDPSTHADAVDFPNFSLPIYPGATNLKIHQDKPAKGAKATTYRVSTAFPAADLTEFFNKEMTKRGFGKFYDPIECLNQFAWNTNNPRTGKWEIAKKPPARYVAMWSNRKEDQLLWVAIDFKPNQKETWTAHVSVQVARLSAYLKEVDMIRKMTHNQADAPALKPVR
ncbi:hypothetical protein [Geomonas ferrireducens]|uniref:hypothetical protein n=1 Tax=Geomonas ferrireducens TaxID=2570227 RepID=UPI0010A7B874|nr:hypothetical protein [Geomonas ferrireducens]